MNVVGQATVGRQQKPTQTCCMGQCKEDHRLEKRKKFLDLLPEQRVARENEKKSQIRISLKTDGQIYPFCLLWATNNEKDNMSLTSSKLVEEADSPIVLILICKHVNQNQYVKRCTIQLYTK